MTLVIQSTVVDMEELRVRGSKGQEEDRPIVLMDSRNKGIFPSFHHQLPPYVFTLKEQS